MSRIPDLGEKNAKLPALLAEYESELDAIEERLRIKGKLLEVAQQEQCAWPMFYEARRVELKTLVKYFDDQVSKVRGTLVRRYTENYSRSLGERAMNSYIDADEAYLKMRELYLEVEELYEKYAAIADAFTKRGFALRDLTTAKVNQLHQLPI